MIQNAMIYKQGVSDILAKVFWILNYFEELKPKERERLRNLRSLLPRIK